MLPWSVSQQCISAYSSLSFKAMATPSKLLRPGFARDGSLTKVPLPHSPTTATGTGIPRRSVTESESTDPPPLPSGASVESMTVPLDPFEEDPTDSTVKP